MTVRRRRFSVLAGAFALAMATLPVARGDVVWTEQFETDGGGARYFVTEFTDGAADYFGRNQNGDVSLGTDYTGVQGSYWLGGQDQDGDGGTKDQTITFAAIAVDGYQNLVFKALFAESRPASDGKDDIDAGDYIHVQYRMDAGSWAELLWFQNDGTTFNTTFQVDSDFDGVGEGAQLETAMAQFSAAVPVTGSSLELRVVASVDAGDEDWAMDDLALEGDSAGPPSPEPTNYPTAFAAVPGTNAITLTWTDSVGGELPSRYLVRGRLGTTISVPGDGVAVANDADLSDGAADLNVAYGVQTATFAGLDPATRYHFRIFPYNNTGTNTDYKTDGSVPEASAVPLSGPNIVHEEGFESGGFGSWTSYNVWSDKDWGVWSADGGAEGSTYYAEMNGYLQDTNSNDWLISPAIDLAGYSSASMLFQTQWRFGSEDAANYLKLKYSLNYGGSGDPTAADWSELAYAQPPGSDVWLGSGTVALDALVGETVFLAFHYYSEDAPRRWRVDEIAVSAEGAGRPGLVVIVR
jgi:hypothetical protein